MATTDAAESNRPDGDHDGDPVTGTDRAAAFDWARDQRAARHSLAAALGAGAESLRDVVARACDEPWGSATLLFVLESLPAARKIDTRRALRGLGLDGDVSLCDLDEAQREVVLREFPLPAVDDPPTGGVVS
jgi:hypothetical protein